MYLLRVLTNNSQVYQGVPGLGCLEVYPASVEATVGLVDVIEEQEGGVGGGVEVGPVAEPPGGLLAPGGSIGGPCIIPEKLRIFCYET